MCFICGSKHVYHLGFDKFGTSQLKGDIAYRNASSHKKLLKRILHVHEDEDDSYDRCWQYNFSWKRFRTHYGKAVEADDFLKDGCWEWRRKVKRGNNWEKLCNPEDVMHSKVCRHDDTAVCNRCDIPICNECWTLACLNRPIPKALCNDNFIGYIHNFFADNEVTWIEATIGAGQNEAIDQVEQRGSGPESEQGRVRPLIKWSSVDWGQNRSRAE